ncbi:MAG: preprotein translocase subunit SecE [Oscillospiraceae bacterium]|nr:preprotein translocase subunit SecE [Oscillospiraceae bacterium]MBQ6756557.1 preprotein translocase subunit SecE [Oscillospiraceae bacterium]MBR1842330.1 preprotein translocase subunit SecE [Oscillospiraceae bacterium]
MATAEKKKFTERLANWWRGMKAELKKVVWPSRKQVVNNSAVVFASIIASGVVIWAFDWLASNLIQIIIKLF